MKVVQLKWWEKELRMPQNHYELTETFLLPKPLDIPEDYIGYNPSAIWTVNDKSDKPHDILYVRVEPDHLGSDSSHLGKSRVRPYEIDLIDLRKPLKPYPEADEQIGEDASLTRINRRLASGAIERIWLLSCVDAKPFPFKPNEVRTLRTRYYAGKKLDRLEHIADGPVLMKDIRISEDLIDDTALHVYGRPRKIDSGSGNITYTKINGIEDLDEEVISQAPYIDEKLFPKWGSSWGGVNDIIPMGADNNLLLGHRAWKTDQDDGGVHYEAVLYDHNIKAKRITELGILATASAFSEGHVKDNVDVNLSDVVFPGGGYNGNLNIVSFGVRDGAIGVGLVQKK